MLRQEVGRVSQRAQIILLSAQRRSVPDIAILFAVSRATVRFWIRRFDAVGPQGLQDDPRSGRPRKATAMVEATLEHALRGDPAQVNAHFLATIWTTAMLTLLLHHLNLTVGQSTVRMALRRMGLRWRRPRLAMPPRPDPEKAHKQWRIVAAVIAAGPEAVVLYADESRLQTLPLVRAMWQWVGQQVRIPTPGTNVSRTLFGALHLYTGQWTYLVRDRMRATDFIAFLEHLMHVYAEQPIILIVDNYGSHTAKTVTSWLDAHPQVQLFFLPKYCSHLNPVEAIWRQLKQQLAANRLYGSITLLVAAVEQFFAAMTAAQALRWAAAQK
jgi:transposase